ncbi:MAG: lamin tail domain-containing protein [Candidatus Bipolaricaulota bacterium]
MKFSRIKIFLAVAVTSLALSSVVMAADGGSLVISEVAWAGTRASWADEWIELRNRGEEDIDLTGWSVVWDDSVLHLGSEEENTVQVINKFVPPGGVILLERTDDETVSTVNADLIFKGSLPNSGTKLELVGPDGEVVQTIDARDGWPAGTASDGDPSYASMELIEGQWVTSDQPGREKDKNGERIYGTPGGPVG